MVVDAWAQVLLVELEVEVILVDLLFIVMGSCRVKTQLGAIGRAVLAYLLGLCGGHVQTSPSLDDLRGLLETLKYLEHHGQVGSRHGKDVLAVVVEDEVGVKVPCPERRTAVPWIVALGVLHVLL
jgi:hypothetical protein